MDMSICTDIRRPAWLPTYSVWLYACLCIYINYLSTRVHGKIYMSHLHALLVEQGYTVGSSSKGIYLMDFYPDKTSPSHIYFKSVPFYSV